MLRREYPSGDIALIARSLGRTVRAVRAEAEKLGVRRDGFTLVSSEFGASRQVKYSVNERFFDTWSPQMAYILGFVLADGCVTDDGLFKVASADRDVIEFVATSMESTHPIAERWSRLSTKPLFELCIRRKPFLASLDRHGIRPRKSHDVKWPDVPPEMFAHVVRGYFDGDGHVYYHDGSIHSLRLNAAFTSGSMQIVAGLQKALSDVAIKSHILVRKDYPDNYRLRLSTRPSVMLYRLMYQGDCGFHLARKRSVFETYLASDARRSHH
jgi:hypothetical protein